jgi:hypothetical protein
MKVSRELFYSVSGRLKYIGLPTRGPGSDNSDMSPPSDAVRRLVPREIPGKRSSLLGPCRVLSADLDLFVSPALLHPSKQALCSSLIALTVRRNVLGRATLTAATASTLPAR